jgi:hypothetical protein
VNLRRDNNIGLQSIAMHKRLTAYIYNDLLLLLNLLSKAKKIVVTPNTLTETSNLAAHISEPARSHIYQVFKAIIAGPKVAERYVESNVAAARPEFFRLGLI